jgi:glutamate-1-semialdehyde aminotransferase
VGTTARAMGVPDGVRELTEAFPYNNPGALFDRLDSSVACVILEPMIFEHPHDDFLRVVKRACEDAGALLVFDEMWTGFRLALGGAQEFFDVTADLACFSKAVANGMPLSVLTGRADVMRLLEDDVFFFTTFGGEALSLAATQATMNVLEKENVPAALAATGKKLKDGYLEIARQAGLEASTKCFGYDARTIVTFADPRSTPLAMKTFVQQEMIARGVLWGGFHNVSYSHGPAEVEQVLGAYREVLPLLASALADKSVEKKLVGKELEPVFRKTDNFHLKPRQPSDRK